MKSLNETIVSAAAAADDDGGDDVTGYESRRGLIELHTQRELSVSKPLLRVHYFLCCCCCLSARRCTAVYSCCSAFVNWKL